jgi:hypothetical protein
MLVGISPEKANVERTNGAAMSNGISWGEYILTVTLALTAYYAAIGLWIYVQRLKVPTSNNGRVVLTTQNDNSIKRDIPKIPFVDTPEQTFQDVESLKERLREVISETFYKKLGRKALLENLSQDLKKYPGLIGTPFQEGIQGFIVSECNRHGPVGLRAYELKELWNADCYAGPMFK